jgi:catechol 2,3-dioxygenase-like lactoylglutathione lyase family enzyme
MEIHYRHGIALVQNMEESKHFYRDIIGLPIEKDYGSFVLFSGNFAIHSADLFYSYIKKPYQGEKMGHDNVDFYFTTSDLDGLQSRLKENKVCFIHEILQQAWGERVIRFYDPDGHIVEIGDADKD